MLCLLFANRALNPPSRIESHDIDDCSNLFCAPDGGLGGSAYTSKVDAIAEENDCTPSFHVLQFLERSIDGFVKQLSKSRLGGVDRGLDFSSIRREVRQTADLIVKRDHHQAIGRFDLARERYSAVLYRTEPVLRRVRGVQHQDRVKRLLESGEKGDLLSFTIFENGELFWRQVGNKRSGSVRDNGRNLYEGGVQLDRIIRWSGPGLLLSEAANQAGLKQQDQTRAKKRDAGLVS